MTTVSTTAETSVARWGLGVSGWGIAVGAALLLAFVPVLWVYGATLWHLPHYEFALLLPIAAAFLAVPRFRHAGTLHPGKAIWFFPLIGAGGLLLAASVVLNSPWFGAVSAICTLLAVVYGLGGTRLLARMLPVCAVLVLGVRLPLNLDFKLTTWLQANAAEAASLVLTKFGVLHVLEGNVVEVPGRRFMVEEACSGIQSLFAITACTVFFAVWTCRHWLRTLLLLAVGWLWVWAANVVRVVGITILAWKYNLPVDEGLGHDVFSITLFTLTLGLIISSDRLLLFLIPMGLFRGREADYEHHEPGELRRWGPTRLPAFERTWVSSPVVFLCFSALAVLQWLPMLAEARPVPIPTRLGQLSQADLPARFGSWELEEFVTETRAGNSQWGEFSHTWKYRTPTGKRAVISVDYPFRGWHELTICYVADGWNLTDRAVVPFAPSAGFPAEDKCVVAEIERPGMNQFACLAWGVFDERQQPMGMPEALGTWTRLRQRVENFWLRLRTLGAVQGDSHNDAQTYQLQVLVQGFAPVSTEERGEVHALLAETHRILEAKLPGGTEATP